MMLVRTKVNDGFGDICCNAAKHSLQVQSDAAQAIAALAKGGFVRLADIGANRSEGQLSARISSAQAQVTDYASLKATLLSR